MNESCILYVRPVVCSSFRANIEPSQRQQLHHHTIPTKAPVYWWISCAILCIVQRQRSRLNEEICTWILPTAEWTTTIHFWSQQVIIIILRRRVLACMSEEHSLSVLAHSSSLTHAHIQLIEWHWLTTEILHNKNNIHKMLWNWQMMEWIRDRCAFVAWIT